MATELVEEPDLQEEKAREQRLRRAAKRLGWAVQKSRCRNPQLSHYGGYWLINPYSNMVVYGIWGGNGPEATLDNIEWYLTEKGAFGGVAVQG